MTARGERAVWTVPGAAADRVASSGRFVSLCLSLRSPSGCDSSGGLGQGSEGGLCDRL
jgi:hypothetical protein